MCDKFKLFINYKEIEKLKIHNKSIKKTYINLKQKCNHNFQILISAQAQWVI